MRTFDVLVIGAGPAGYTCAIRCAQLGLDVACVDAWVDDHGKPSLGGTCLNVGCIPSKALLESSEEYAQLATHYSAHGIHVTDVDLDIPAMQARKTRIVKALTGGVASLFKKNKVTWIAGHARCLGGMQVEVTPQDDPGKPETVQATHIVIATGSEPIPLAAAPVDGDRILDSTGALALTEIPKRLGIIGAGVIGLEMGSVWNRLGSQVVLLEAQDTFLAPVDRDIAEQARRELKKQGLDIRMGARVTATHATKTQVRVNYQDGEGEHELKVDRLIVAVGRRPHTADLFVEESGIILDEKGYVQVGDDCRTEVPGIFAIGDVVRGPMLAHKGMDEGIAVAETIAGHPAEVNYDAIPWVIYTSPEIAWVGATEEGLKARGVEHNVGTFPFRANGRARSMEQTVGLVKLLSDASSDRLLGAHLFGPSASELINELVLAMEFGASAEDIARTCHAHPSLSEALREAALAAGGRAIHI
jgi:dihydrolipoamide dehydrogenase